jgi:hypothetical protein
VSRESLVAVFGFLAAELGLRMRDPAATIEHMQLAGGLLVQSVALRNVQVRAAAGGDDSGEAAVVDTLLNVPLPGPGLHGQPAEWTLAAFAYMGVVDAFIELDPDFTPPER